MIRPAPPRSSRSLALVLLLLVAVAIMFTVRPARGGTPNLNSAIPIDHPLSVMTYNVEGLPFPARIGRSRSLAAIGERLRELRSVGRQPHIVLLQEAFSEDAAKIGALGGYRYIADGPSRDLAGALPRTAADIAFANEASQLKGEADGKWTGSGLRILSDYPIVGVRRIAFPAFACGGFDCLANKGAVMALIKVPALSAPVAVVDTHLNSRYAAGVSFDRSLYAYHRQVDALSAFLKANYVSGAPLIVAGDFNIGKDKARAAYVEQAATRWWNGAGQTVLPDAMHACAADDACAAGLSDDARYSMKRRRDWQFLGHGGGIAFDTRQIATPFGHEADGTMLSDHVGYIAYYDWRRPTLAGPHT
ncbi:endonuclease/exonuclease/phosphatase family protein [Sphingomonas montanisoli]|uniref:Endonuclease/exonuclease/phosphatase n=1 Tax=Sphingomonas montanisoli TaxID=2606412 RepID=A0A5D9CHP3_9SPHN|nr:endonuclease/exonuclease/phosphatase family protein [Sphingomonas montanisoli]TZG29555.1 endonuclease/exonuclease/phosphatase [Sphingomonas montanisoli]